VTGMHELVLDWFHNHNTLGIPTLCNAFFTRKKCPERNSGRSTAPESCNVDDMVSSVIKSIVAGLSWPGKLQPYG
jgi:hypothetical protein